MESVGKIAQEMDMWKQGKKIGDPEKGYCSKHEANFKEYDFRKWGCLECMAEEKAKRLEDKRQLDARNHATSVLDVPRRFSGASFKGYISSGRKQDTVLSSMIDFADDHKRFTGVVMLGGVGTGKTHLAYAACLHLAANGIACKFTNVTKVIREIRMTWKKGYDESEDTVVDRFSSYDVLVIDEIGSQYGTDSERITINEIINNRYEKMLPTVVVGNVSVSEIQAIVGARVYDRLTETGLVLFFEWDSWRQR